MCNKCIISYLISPSIGFLKSDCMKMITICGTEKGKVVFVPNGHRLQLIRAFNPRPLSIPAVKGWVSSMAGNSVQTNLCHPRLSALKAQRAQSIFANPISYRSVPANQFLEDQVHCGYKLILIGRVQSPLPSPIMKWSWPDTWRVLISIAFKTPISSVPKNRPLAVTIWMVPRNQI